MDLHSFVAVVVVDDGDAVVVADDDSVLIVVGIFKMTFEEKFLCDIF